MIFVSRVTGLLWVSPPTGNGRCQMFFVVDVFAGIAPLQNIFCAVVGDDAHIVPFCF